MTHPQQTQSDELDFEGKIAIIGMAGRFPEAPDVEQLWQNLVQGRESIRKLDRKRVEEAGIDMALLDKDNYVDAFGWLEDIDMFDAGFFAMSPRETEIRDPQHRLLLETSYLALENAGYSPDKFSGDIALFSGIGSSGYLYKNLMPRQDLLETLGGHSLVISNEKDYASTFVSYKLNITGASININTSCSSSLVSVHYGMQNLLNFESDIVLAGGSAINSDQDIGYHYTEGGIHPPDGHIRPFDEKALGTIGGSGAGIVVMKRLEDAIADGDHIHGILLASVVNNDGANKVGYTAPSINGQSRVIREALNLAQLDASEISYVETHGTGTALGDPIEVQALTDAYRQSTGRQQYCAIGSLKSNIGHLGAASGVSGLIKVLMAMKHKQIPASINFAKPNPEIDFESSPFFVNSKLTPWSAPSPLHAGVSSFGIGGTNVHIVVESAPQSKSSDSDAPQVLVLSAKSRRSLDENRNKLAQHIADNPQFSLSDIAYTLQSGRQDFSWRTAVVAQDRDHAIELLQSSQLCQLKYTGNEKTVVMFPGQGSQYLAMGKTLYFAGGVFKETIDLCCQLSQGECQLDLMPFFLGEDSVKQSINDTTFVQPLLFVIEYAYGKLLQSFGVKADAYTGHSIGEYVAACFAGVFSLQDAIKLVCIRGRLMSASPEGSMLAIRKSADEIRPYVQESGLELAAINSRSHCVVSGAVADIEVFTAALNKMDIHCRILQAAHAFHSKLMDEVLEEFGQCLHGITFNSPQTPFLSNLTGDWITAEQACSRDYWVKHLRGCVNFASGISTLFNAGFKRFIEAGPGNTLTIFVNSHKTSVEQAYTATLGRHIDQDISDSAQFLSGLAQLWRSGGTLDFGQCHQTPRYRVPLPNYQFDRQSYWIAPPKFNAKFSGTVSVAEIGDHQRPVDCGEFKVPKNALQRQLTEIWQTCFGMESIGIDDDFYQLGGDSLLATRVVVRIKQKFSCRLEFASFMKRPTIDGVSQILTAMGVEDKEQQEQRISGEI